MKFEATWASVIAKGLGFAPRVEKEGRRRRSRRLKSDKSVS